MRLYVVVLLICALIVGAGFLVNSAYHQWGRTLIYPENIHTSLYPGLGERLVQYSGTRIYVNPKKDAAPFYDDAWKRFLYPDSDYDVVEMAEKAMLIATVGHMSGWEEIPDSPDKYIILTLSSGVRQKFRVAFAQSKIYGEGDVESGTILAVENVGWRYNSESKNSIEQIPGQFTSSLGFDRMNRSIKNGDTVVILPIMKPPYYVAKDGEGNVLAMAVVLRRVNGVVEYENEIKLKGE